LYNIAILVSSTRFKQVRLTPDHKLVINERAWGVPGQLVCVPCLYAVF
jgi:hypothetical protein